MSENEESKKLWGGRFSGVSDPLMDELNYSIGYDKRLYKVDILGSIAYAHALQDAGLLSLEESTLIEKGLNQVLEEWEQKKFVIKESDEDIHTANERRLTEIIGAVGGKLHTGRSRNDQVATDMRLWLREEIKILLSQLHLTIQNMVEIADENKDIILPGYTHLQRAQPIRFSHWLLNYIFRFKSDYQRLTEILQRVNQLPLGAGALAGNPFSINQKKIAEELQFSEIIPNSILAVSDRDFIIEFLFWASLTGIHISQVSEDLIIYSSKEFDYIQLNERHSTGSSLMPQKCNPDSLELLRGKSGRIFGKLSGFMMTMKGLPSSYNKDMQEDKEPMFDTVDTMKKCIPLIGDVISMLTVNNIKMAEALSEDMLATDLADYLVRKGVPFRESHHHAGQLVLRSEELETPITQLPLNVLKEQHEAFGDDVKDMGGNFEASCDRRNGIGGTSLQSVENQIQSIKQWLASQEN
ncbi:argininosuccinate lyase [Neoconidiobolus thromboides FSU 785]|nr:argininosuccinate lyase [Neoconidiobolus thromboides FSU 785]